MVVDDSTGLSVPPGFEVDLVYKVDKKKYGSWISMTFDKQGRLVVSDQYKAGTFLIDLPQVGTNSYSESLSKSFLSIVDSGECSLLLIICTWYLKVKWFAFPVSENGDFGKEEKLFQLYGGSEHGPHSLIVTEDGKGLYLVAGNFARTPSFRKIKDPHELEG